jgi:hypothetical protein
MVLDVTPDMPAVASREGAWGCYTVADLPRICINLGRRVTG